jgi:hypothetical protein
VNRTCPSYDEERRRRMNAIGYLSRLRPLDPLNFGGTVVL